MSDVATVLEDIKGIGPATRTAVLDAYPTLDSIDKASNEDLEAIKGVGPATAKAIKAAVAKAEKKTAGTRTKAASKQAAAEVADAAKDTVDGTVVEIREGASKVGEQADVTVQQVKAAMTSLQNVISAALDAGKESLPEAQRQLKAAGTSLRKLGPTIVEALEQLREERKKGAS